MKTKILSTLIVVFSCLLVFATGADNELVPQATNGFPLEYLSLLDVLYFNQTIDFTLPAGSTVSIDHIAFRRGKADVSPSGFRLKIEYANLPEEADKLDVYVKDGSGNTYLAYTKTVILMQKLGTFGAKSVADDDDLFLLDGHVMPLEQTNPREILARADKLTLNFRRFNQEGIQLKSFDISIVTATGSTQLHSEDGSITAAMKAAIGKLNEGDQVVIEHLMSTYTVAGQQVNMNLNYKLDYTIGIPN